ncbi:MAG: TM2 domain-containing protein [Clostridia bacterium]|nr:TM2 domain-containing protein [Clostridia bacterium]
MYCSQCGKQISEQAKFCPECGASNQATQTVTRASNQPIVVNVINNNNNTNTTTDEMMFPSKSRWTAFFLCFFLGYLGIHKFYVGKTGMGLLYLFTGGLFGVGWVIDTIILLFGGSSDKWGRPLI